MEYRNWREKRKAELGVDDEENEWIWLGSHPTHQDYYHKAMIDRFIKAAVEAGVDPYTYIALGISETGLGNQDEFNPSRVNIQAHPSLQGFLPPEIKTDEDIRDRLIDFGADYLSQGYKKFPNDELMALQFYSGLGKTIYGGHPDVVEYRTGSKKSFGKDYRKINYRKEKPQAKRVVNIRGHLKKNPEFVEFIEQAKIPHMQRLQKKMSIRDPKAGEPPKPRPMDPKDRTPVKQKEQTVDFITPEEIMMLMP